MPNPADLRWLNAGIQGVQARHQERVASLYAGRPGDDVVAIAGRFFGRSHGLAGVNEIDMLQQPEAWLADVLGDMARHGPEGADPVTFRPFVIEIDPWGVHFVDALLGARVFFHEGQVWSDELQAEPAELRLPDLTQSKLLADTIRLTHLAVAATGGQVFITTPVLSCPINIGMNLFGQRLLVAMLLAPDAAQQALRVITATLQECIRVFAAAIPDPVRRGSVAENRYAPSGFGFIDGCATQLLSAANYRDFVAELDRACLSSFPHGGMMHLCGAHAQHIPTWRTFRELRAIQINDRAAEDLELYFHGLRDDQLIYISPTATMTIERIMAITGGNRIVLQCELAAARSRQPRPTATEPQTPTRM
jgi:hypothetical protein